MAFGYDEKDDRYLDVLEEVKEALSGRDLYVSTALGSTLQETIHTMVLSVVVSGATVAVKVIFWVALRLTSVLSRLIVAAGVGSTFIVMVELTLPHVTVITVSPTPTAVTLPSASTVATEGFDEV